MNPRNLILFAILLVMAAACGGGGGTGLGEPLDLSGGQQNAAPAAGSGPVEVVESTWNPGVLPQTEPLRPADISAFLDSIQPSHAVVSPEKGTSALLSSIAAGSITATSPPGGGVSHEYIGSDGMVWAEAQSTAVHSEYHVSGTVSSLDLDPDGLSYATIGLVTFATWDYSINLAPDAPQSSYMFNQNVYLLIRRVGTDLPGVYRVRLGDYNSRWGSHEALVALPFSYDIVLEPNNPVLSTPGSPPYTTHDVGLATMLINGFQIGSPLTYGDNNWGWYRAADWEHFDLASGGALLTGQVYSSGSSVTSSMDFQANLNSGTPSTADPSEWWCFGQSRNAQRLSDYNGPQTNNIDWTFAFGGTNQTQPTVGPDGTIYSAAQDGLTYAINPDGTLKWTIGNSGSNIFGTPTIGADGTIYRGNHGPDFYAFTDNGASASVKWVLTLGTVGRANPAIGPDGTIYVGNTDGNFYAVRDNGAFGSVKWILPGIVYPYAQPAIADDGTIYCVDQIGNNLFCITDNGLSGTINWTIPLSPGGAGTWAGAALAEDGTIYAIGDLAGFGQCELYAIQDLGATYSIRDTYTITEGFSESSLAIGPDGSIYLVAGSRMYAIEDDGASFSLKWTHILPGYTYSSPAVGADGLIYIVSNNTNSTVVTLQDNGSGLPPTVLWTYNIGSSSNYSSNPVITEDGSLIVSTVDAPLISFKDTGLILPIQIDCTTLADARFTLHRPDTTVITGPHTTNTVYNADGDLATGDQFYVQFQTDPVLQPNDQAVYPARPAGGFVTVNASTLTIDPALQPYFTSTGRTLELRAGAYNRVTNDVTSLTHALYSLIDSDLATTIYGPNDTDDSDAETVVLRDGVSYRPRFSAEAYPTAGSHPFNNGSPESIYPTEWTTGWLSVDGDIPGGGAGAQILEGGTALGSYFTEAGLTATLGSDAFCRFECDPSALSIVEHGFYDVIAGAWITPLPGRHRLADPFNSFVFARGTQFQVRPSFAPGGSPTIVVDPGQLLDGATEITRSLGFAGDVTLTVLPVRVWDDPDQPDPGIQVTFTGSGWDVIVEFLLQYGAGPYTVEVDTDFGATWNDGTAGRTQALPNSPYAAPGQYSDTISINFASQPAGTYTIAIRVTDSNADQYTYVWPTTPLILAVPTGWYNAVPNPDSTDDTGLHSSMEIIDGVPCIAYYDFTNGDLKFVRATNALGTSWEAPITVDSTNDTGRYASLAIINGNPAIAYWEGTNGYLKYARAADASGADWFGPGSINVIADESGFSPSNGVGQYCSLAQVNGRPAISCMDSNLGALKYVRSHDADGGNWTGGSAEDTIVYNPVSGSAGFDSSLAVVNNRPCIAFHHRLNTSRGNLMFSRAGNPNGSSWGGPSIVDTGGASGQVGEYCSLVVVNSQPAISYHWNSADGDLMYIRSTNNNGTAWPASPVTVHDGAGGVVGMWTSMAIIGGFPAISYYDATNGDMLYIRATNADGTAWSAFETVDSAGSVGGYSSLLEVSGQPAMSYYDFTNGDLKYSRFYP